MLQCRGLLLHVLLPTRLLPAGLLLPDRRQAGHTCQRKVLLKVMTDNAIKAKDRVRSASRILVLMACLVKLG
jgi:hypothetical protein